MNRLLALLIVMTIAGGTAFGQSQGTRRVVASPATRTTEVGSPARMSAVPRPSSPSGRTSARVVSERSLLQEPVEQGEVVYADEPEPVYTEEVYDPNQGLAAIGGCSDGSCGTSGCDTCGLTCGSPFGNDLCDPYCLDSRILCLALPSHGWVSVDYMMFYQPGMDTPALVTNSRPNFAAANVLYGGDNDILSGRLDGIRARFGWWFVNRPNLGIEGEYLTSGDNTETFDRLSDGSVGNRLYRPFFNVVTGLNDVSIVAEQGTNTPNGRVRIDSSSEFQGVAVRFKRFLCCNSSSACSLLLGREVPVQSRLEATLGWRYYQLGESLLMNENKTQRGGDGVFRTFNITDSFETLNQFNGVELGVHWQGRRGYWTLDTLMRVSIGNMRQRVDIMGQTLVDGAILGSFAGGNPGGVLAVEPNASGTPYIRDELGISPELGAALRYQLTQRLELKVGYSFMYLSNVVRPGEQIDFDVDPNWFPQSVVYNGPNRRNSPSFAFNDTGYYIHGLTLGGEYRW